MEVHVDLDLGGLKPYSRDTNVMPQWAGSSSMNCATPMRTTQNGSAPRENRSLLDGTAAG